MTDLLFYFSKDINDLRSQIWKNEFLKFSLRRPQELEIHDFLPEFSNNCHFSQKKYSIIQNQCKKVCMNYVPSLGEG